jgi:hypothetical protein
LFSLMALSVFRLFVLQFLWPSPIHHRFGVR